MNDCWRVDCARPEHGWNIPHWIVMTEAEAADREAAGKGDRVAQNTTPSAPAPGRCECGRPLGHP